MTKQSPRSGLAPAEVHRYAYENPRPDLVSLVPASARRVLDLGCASGAVGAAIKEDRAAEVIGVEVDAEYARIARGRLDGVIVADIDKLSDDPALFAELGEFDCLLAGDVLEHLRDPWSVLGEIAKHLRPGATAIVSLPNVRHWEVLWTVGVRGTFARHDQGIFDRTHLRWFTAVDGIALVVGAGLEFVGLKRVYTWRTVTGRWDGVARAAGRTPLRPLFALQNIVVARRPGAEPNASSGAAP